MSVDDYNPLAYKNKREVNSDVIKVFFKICEIEKKPHISDEFGERFNFNIQKPPGTVPLNFYMNSIEFFALKLYPAKSLEEALEELGYRTVQVYFDSPFGAVLKVLAGILGPYNGAKNYAQTISKRFPWSVNTMEEVRQGYVRYRVQGIPGTGAMMRGAIKASVEAASGKIKKITTTIEAAENLVHEIELY
jgi:uncharacterized protein (TIGR02265 family)